MSTLWALVDQAVADALSAHPDYLTPRGEASARKMIVRKVTGALRDNISAPKRTEDETEVQPEAQRSTVMNAWSKEWWAALIRRIEHKQATDFMMRCAASGGQWAAETEPLLAEAIDRLQSYPSDGPVVAAWRPWFKAHRVELPEWRKQVWVFLPSTDPPSQESTT